MRYLFIILFILSCAQGKKDKSITAEATDSGKVKETKFAEGLELYNVYSPIDGEEKRPFLIYYIVDGANAADEPYMELAVNHEIASLESVCRNDARHVNWIIIRNSEVLKNGTYSYCWEGKQFKGVSLKHVLNKLDNKYHKRMKPDNLTKKDCWFNGENTENSKFFYYCDEDFTYPHPYKSLYEQIKITREELSKEVNSKVKVSTVDEICSAPNPLQHLKEKCKYNNSEELQLICKDNFEVAIKTLCVGEINFFDVYKERFPTIHPYFIKALVNNKILHPFLKDQFLPIFHFKSHGHMDYALTGLLPHQLYVKSLSQKAKLEAFKRQLDTKTSFKSKMDDIIQKDPVLQQMKPANKLGLLDQSDPCGLSETEKAFLGTNDIFSLGASSVYLGNQPGITPEVFYELISQQPNIDSEDNLHVIKENRSLFVFLEACDANIKTNRWSIKNKNIKNTLGGVFTAIGSLGYRNLDWDVIFNELGHISSRKQSQFLQKLLLELSKRVENNVSNDANEASETYLKTLSKFQEIQSKNESN